MKATENLDGNEPNMRKRKKKKEFGLNEKGIRKPGPKL